ncbi:MAG TPA: hypothetical protein VN256_22415 [Pyrinomonadaceae bacterium]|nr:hypothetical protein [Pyrinomonadaceae bacterium]
MGFTTVRLVFDDAYAYISTPDGLYRTSKTLNPTEPLKLIGFENKQITNLYVHRNVLYVLKVGEWTGSGRATDHSFLKSEDRGQTFTPIDKDLEDCLGGGCAFLTPTHAEFVGSLIFLNAGAGRNLLVSKDQGASWSALSGSLEIYACSEPAFELVDNRVLMGGECPLDFAYLWAGALQPNLLSWVPGQELKPISTPPLNNRNFQFIERRGSSPLVFAGVEGGLLKSFDAGRSFRFVIHYPINGTERTYPYVRRILFPAKHPDLFIAGGFDKAKSENSSYLAYSTDHGESWVNFSSLTHTPELSPYDVAFLREDPQGRVLLGLVSKQTQTITVGEVMIEMPAAPTLVTEAESGRALALDSVSTVRGPFPLVSANPLSPGRRTRISLFARDLNLLPGEGLSVVTVQAEDSQQRVFQLPVESVSKVPNSEWLTQVVVRLPEELPRGEVQVSIRVRSAPSNKAPVTIN